MAGPSKRPRDIDDVDGTQDEIEIESASSSFRQTVNKRTKVAVAREARSRSALLSDTDEDDNDEGHFDDLLEDDDQDVDAMDGAEDTFQRYTDDEIQADEVDELRATQIVRKQLNRYKENIPMEEGIIEEVFCRNFMCHSKLRIVLGPLINFIVGHNGSGKSAVLTALQICLGGKATVTNRGTSLKDFIKHGQDSASLSVKIKNQGENAYKPQEYGRSITVERHFNRAGSSGFRIKNENGKEVCKKKSELDDLLDFFALQLDNPINVLTQDKAREFLSNSTPSEKYKFFIRGTNLHTLDSDYKLFEEQLDLIYEKLRTRGEDIKHLLEKRNQAEQRKKRGERSARLSTQVTKLRRQCAWKQVQDEEIELERKREAVQKQQEDIQEREREADDVDARFEAEDDAKDAAQRRVEAFQEQLQPVTEAHTAAKKAFDDNKQLLLNHVNEARNITQTIKSHRKEVTRLASEVELEQQRLSDSGGAEHARQVEELAELKQQIEDAKTREQEQAAEWPTLQNDERAAAQSSQEAEAEKQQASARSATAQALLRDFAREQGGRYEPYIPGMERLCKEIARETRWSEMPIGPIGLHIHLLKPEWSSILEKTFANSLDGFIVSCRDDQNILSQLTKKAGCNAPIFIQSSQPIDTTSHEPEDNVDTMLSVLRIDEPAVRNLVITTVKAEQLVLIGDSKEASEYMMRRPKNVSATLAHAGGPGSQGGGIRYDLSRSGQPRSGPIAAWRGSVRMKTDREEQKSILQRRSNEAKKEVDAAAQRHQATKKEHLKTEQAINRHKREANQLKASRQRLEVDAETKEAEIESSRPQDGKLQELQNQLDEAKAEQQTSESSLQDCYANKAKLDDTARELKEKLDAAQIDLDEAEGRIRQAETALREAERRREQVLYEKNEAHDDVKNAKTQGEHLQQRVADQEERVQSFIEQARQICERVAVEREISFTTLDNQLTALIQEHEREKRKIGKSTEELTREFVEAERAYQTAKDEKREQDEIAKTLRETLKERRYRWKLFRHYISVRAKTNFMYLLSERQFRGRVMLNHDTQELDIKVEPDIARESDTGRQAKTLSGGEKSFSTICLLLSIWEAMGSPIRCLDEFDVFMDSVNRKQSMDLMIQTARRSVGRQFILITPQSMNNVDVADDVRIHKMSDPERGQQPLSFNGQEV